MKPVVVSMAYGPKYEALMPRFFEFARLAGFEAYVEVDRSNPPKEGLEAWKDKPRLIRRFLSAGRSVLWMDVDFLFLDEPAFTFAEHADAALFSIKPGVFEDGVMLWHPTAPALAALSRWEDRCKTSRDWTNTHLAPAIREASAIAVELPPTYHWVDRWKMAELYGRREPVIREVPRCAAKPSP